MNGEAMVVIRLNGLNGVEDEEELRDHLEKRCAALAEEFPETSRFEINLSTDALEIDAHAHVVGKNTEAAAHASAPEARRAGERVIDKLERELRRHHDKKIFGRRREAQRNPGKRTS